MADSLGRSNIWAFIIYPDSWPDNWHELISNFHVPCAVSPLHDADLNGDGTEKKPHRHVLINFGLGKKKSEEQVYVNYCRKLHATLPIAIDSERGYVRYFVHLDNPEKTQYNLDDIITFSGYDLSDAFKPSASRAHQIMNEIKVWILENDIKEFKDLQLEALLHIDTWAYVLNMYNCFSIYKLLDSNRHCRKALSVDENGEIS